MNHSGRLFSTSYTVARGYLRPHALFVRSGTPYRASKWIRWRIAEVIVIDADALTYIMNSDILPHPGETNHRKTDVGGAGGKANVLRPHGEFAIIGPGGGIDVSPRPCQWQSQRYRH